MNKTIGVGIIGGNVNAWASQAHIPALELLKDSFEFVSLSTSRKESAEEASKKFNVPLAYDNHESLVSRPEVNLVTVSVRVPEHMVLASSAINAGKNIYCEWPLGNGLAEAEELARMAKEKKVYNAVGLQARSSPGIRYIYDLLKQGFVGEVLSTSVIGSGLVWGARAHQEYLHNIKNGANLLTIPFGHALDAILYCLGEFKELSATLATRRPFVKKPDSEELMPSDVPDQVVVNGILDSGAVASVHYRGGLFPGTNFHWEINGTEGTIVVTASSGHIQMTPIYIKGAKGSDQLVDLPIPDEYFAPFGNLENHACENVAHAYHFLQKDLSSGNQTLPDFDHAVLRHRMIAAIEKAAETGQRQSYLH